MRNALRLVILVGLVTSAYAQLDSESIPPVYANGIYFKTSSVVPPISIDHGIFDQRKK